MKKTITSNNTKQISRSNLKLLYLLGLVLQAPSVWGDATADCNVGAGIDSTECGVFASASGHYSTASGWGSIASGTYSTANGFQSTASGSESTASGWGSTASGIASTAFGDTSNAGSIGSVSVGQKAGYDFLGGGLGVTNSESAIAIGYAATISHASPGAIAIGGDVDFDGVGAQANAPGAIALGKDVVNDIANSMLINVPLRIEGIQNQLLLLENQKTTVAIRSLLKMSNLGPVGFEMEDTDLGHIWQFRSNPLGKFIINRVGNPGNEFFIDGDGNAQFLGEVKANGILLTSSRDSKTDIRAIKPQDFMEKLKQMEVAEWRYKQAAEDDRHISPMAENFYKLFKLGRDAKAINPNDLASVALVAAKELQKKVDKAESENESLKQQLLAQDRRLNQRIATLEKLVANLAMGKTNLTEMAQKVAHYQHSP